MLDRQYAIEQQNALLRPPDEFTMSWRSDREIGLQFGKNISQ